MLALALFILAVLLGITATGIFLSICFALSNRKIEINYLLLNWNFRKYMRMYKQITKQESGKVGKLYYLSHIFFLLAVLSFLGAIISYYS